MPRTPNFKIEKAVKAPRCKPCLERRQALFDPLNQAFYLKSEKLENDKKYPLCSPQGIMLRFTALCELQFQQNKITTMILAEHAAGSCGAKGK